MTGLLLIDKPAGLSSHDVVARLRKVLATREVGHAGTLDPQATGLLVVAVGKATRWLPYLPDGKCYRATLRLGLATDTEDVWGKTLAVSDAAPPATTELKAALESLTDLREQTPPMVSALKFHGRKLYELAREGVEVERVPRPVTIKAVRVLDVRGLEADFEVDCGPGTYVRTLCVEAGTRLGLPACMSALRRLTSGAFSVADALPQERWTKPELEAALLDAARALPHLPAHELTENEAKDVALGRSVALDAEPQAGTWRLNFDGRLWALALAAGPDPWRLQPKRVFAE